MKIIKAPKFKQITCIECGCVFEYEKGDEISFSLFCVEGENIVHRIPHSMLLHCPICGSENELEIEALEECAETNV